MTTLLFTHEACLDHDTGAGHPERAERLSAVLDALKTPEFAGLEWRDAPLADIEALVRVHPRSFVETMLAKLAALSSHAYLDMDTVVSPGSREAALRAAGAAVAAVDAVIAGETDNAFCAVRPPGHHAEPARAMGFCVFNSVAAGAMRARERGLSRVAVVDFDVHHGNGTEAMFRADPELFYASTHQWPLYPGTGRPGLAGVAGNILNVGLPPGAGSDVFRAAFAREILPALDRFKPEMILISAGFDAHRDDPLAGLSLTEDDFAFATEALIESARRHAKGRIVSTLEGGYDLDALALSAAAHVRVLMRES